MELSASLAADLGLLTAALYDPATGITTEIAQTVLGFATNARLAVASFLGLSITITKRTDAVADQVLLHLTLLDDHAGPGDVKTSLVLPGAPDAVREQPHIRIVLYGATPGAFVDLAADLAFLTGSALDGADLDHHHGLAGEPDITGILQDQAVISEAIGVLIAGGRTREQASTELDTLAGAAHTDRVTEATAILTALAPDRSERRPLMAPQP
ncbi:hypothetical protein V3G39_09400 [Dermatophilaceae bacterium Sec6.4]